jgi:hypothetical protein
VRRPLPQVCQLWTFFAQRTSEGWSCPFPCRMPASLRRVSLAAVGQINTACETTDHSASGTLSTALEDSPRFPAGWGKSPGLLTENVMQKPLVPACLYSVREVTSHSCMMSSWCPGQCTPDTEDKNCPICDVLQLLHRAQPGPLSSLTP